MESQKRIISVVVPIYNVAAQYLRQCIDSILNQTFPDLELILVDDGSPDDCGRICEEYAMLDNRIRVIHQENQGASVARNVGIASAKGKWLTFVDSDDWLELDAFEKIINTAERLKTEILHFSGFLQWKNHVEEAHFALPQETLLQQNDKNLLYRSVFNSRTVFSLGTVCCKLYLLDALKNSGVLFLEGLPLQEDALFQIMLTTRLNRIAYFDACLYHYRHRSSSACRAYRPNYDCLYETSSKMLYQAMQKIGADATVWQAMYLLIYCNLTNTITQQYFHPICPMTRKERRHACDMLLTKSIYAEAMKKVKPEIESLRQCLGYTLIKYRQYAAYAFLMRVPRKRWEPFE